MSVDWFTVAAQVINFFILVWLLKKFLYKPILTAMNTRQEKVHQELAQAADQAKLAKEEKIKYIALQEEAREQGQEQLRQSRKDAEVLRKKLFHQIQTEVEIAHVRWQNELAQEKTLFVQQASAQIAEQFQALATHVFHDLADESLEERIMTRFCSMITNNNTNQKKFSQLQNSDELQVFSAFPLSNRSQEMISKVLWQRITTHPHIHFQQEPNLIAGILVSSNNHKLEWNIHHYLADFQAELEKVLAKDIH